MQSAPFDIEHFTSNQNDYTIVDIRNRHEVSAQPVFERSINIPLPELRERLHEIPTSKPIAVHCAGGYRSAIGSSIVAAAMPSVTVTDISNRILDFTAAD